MILLGIVLLISYAFCQNVPTVILSGESRIVSRRILEVDLGTAQQLPVFHDQNFDRVPVQVVNRQDPNEHCDT
ncbi:AMIN domain-containing protein [Caenorhabditis elegans]|uniref:AMIN domain-containing protein n=1 Tax=Caenorhabditis elegans TaxID=6239 RepID=Q9TZ59_CAEEL|nr:AMIN domain-containing protein [Caenorhabditis elegans]CCD61955.2 AMIN domain-containing protein [Caenorhabditis elegans]|eukprot:NP_493700.2 Uncharacterized protein CELE_K01A2.6 [Caenorhabditis elegans]